MFEKSKMFKTEFAGRSLIVETGKFSELANGSCMVRYGETVVHVAATASKKPREGMNFFPLSVDFEERLYAVGKIPGSFSKREGRPSDKAILAARAIDRSIRPLFPKDMRNDVCIVCTVMSVDENCSPEITAMLGASIALSISDIPWDGPISGCFVGMIDDKIIINPSESEKSVSKLSLTVASTREVIPMIEAGAHEISNEEMYNAILAAHDVNVQIISFIENIKKEIGVVFQEVAVFEELNVYDNIDYFCGLYIKNKKTRKQYIEDALSLVGLENYKKFYPKQLSGGLLRRLNIACGVAHKPKIIFLDEPTVAVDPQSRNNILDGIEKLRENGATIIYTTHYMEEVEIICDRVIILDKGKIIASGTTDELKLLAEIEEKVTVEVIDLGEKYIEEIKQMKHVDQVTYHNNNLLITYKKGKNNLLTLMDYLKLKKIKYNKIYSERPTLNDVFLYLTGKELRD